MKVLLYGVDHIGFILNSVELDICLISWLYQAMIVEVIFLFDEFRWVTTEALEHVLCSNCFVEVNLVLHIILRLGWSSSSNAPTMNRWEGWWRVQFNDIFFFLISFAHDISNIIIMKI